MVELWYHSKFEPVSLNKEYIKYKDKHEKHAEVKMISPDRQLALSGAGFAGDDVMIQGGNVKKTKQTQRLNTLFPAAALRAAAGLSG